MSRTLFDIGADLSALDQLCNEAEDNMERAPELDAALATWFEQLHEQEAAKLEGYRLYIARLESEAAAAKAEAEQFAKMAKMRLSRVEWLKDRLKGYLEFTKRERVLTSTNRTIAIQKNGGKLPLVIDDNIKPQDTAFHKLTYEWDKEVIRMRLEQGHTFKFARLGEPGTHLRIK